MAAYPKKRIADLRFFLLATTKAGLGIWVSI